MGLLADIAEDFAGRKDPLLNIASDTGEGPVVILLHGIASSAVTFERVIPKLESSHRCIAIELLGFGDSPVPDTATYTIDEHVTAIHRTVRSLRLTRPYTLVGHSLGSLLGTRYAAVHAREIEHLVLASPPVYLSPGEIGDPATRAHVSVYMKAYEFLRGNKEFAISTAARLDSIFQLGGSLSITEKNWRAFTDSLSNCIESQTMISDMASVTAPTDIVYGSVDQFIAPGTLKILQAMRHVTTHRVFGNDHVVREPLAREIVKVVTQFGPPAT